MLDRNHVQFIKCTGCICPKKCLHKWLENTHNYCTGRLYIVLVQLVSANGPCYAVHSSMCVANNICASGNNCVRGDHGPNVKWVSIFLFPGPRVWEVPKGQTVHSLCRSHLAGGDRRYLSLALWYSWWNILITKGVLATADCSDHAVTELEKKREMPRTIQMNSIQGCQIRLMCQWGREGLSGKATCRHHIQVVIVSATSHGDTLFFGQTLW